MVETCTRGFEAGEMAASERNNSTSVTAAGEDPDRVLARAESPEIVEACVHKTAVATDPGFFVVPVFVVEGALFRGV